MKGDQEDPAALDDRGRELHWAAGGLGWAADDPRVARARLRETAARSESSWRANAPRSLVLAVCFGVCILLWNVIANLYLRLSLITLVALPGLYLARVLWKAQRYETSSSDLFSSILKSGTCPVCSYDLRGSRPEGDGCVVCAECGGAWRAERIRFPKSAGDSTQPPSLLARAGHVLGQALTRMNAQSLTDSRGAQHPVPSLVAIRMSRLIDAREHRRALRRAIRSVRVPTLCIRWLIGGLVIIASLGPIVPFALVAGSAGFGWFVTSSALIGSLCFSMFGVVIVLSDIAVSRRRRVAVMTSRGFCPVCGASMRDIEPEADGCVVCPECAAAW